jgi:hypothetical protein
MSRRLSRVYSAACLFGSAALFVSGCGGFAPTALDSSGSLAPACAVELGGDEACALPSPGSSATSPLPALIRTTYANGAIWVGYNVRTAEAGDLDMYDSGEGMAAGVGFGNGQDVKRLFEITYESTHGHEVFDDGTGSLVSEASHNRVYLGMRRYLLSVGEDAKRVAPFVVSGVTYQTIDGSGDVATGGGTVTEAEGVGVYLGTGVELYIGTSSRVAVALDVRGAFMNWDGYPEGTGRLSQVGSALSLVYHF